MVHKETARPRGRPRIYDPESALTNATDTFWSRGFAGTSLDQLCEATGMNRPSLYLAFGDKRALYLAALRRYIAQSGAAIAASLEGGRPLAVDLKKMVDLVLAIYLPPGDAARGCFMIATAVPEALDDPEIRSLLHDGVAEFDRLLEARLARAKRIGELPATTDAAMAAKIVTAVVHTLAVRARGGESRKALRAIADAAIAMLCEMPQGAKRKR